MATVRAYRAEDVEALRAICLLTGDKGADGTALYPQKALIGDIYAANYAVYAPELVFVVEDAEGVGGYVVGALDTAAYDAWMAEVWTPQLRRIYAPPPEDRARWTPQDFLLDEAYRPTGHSAAIVADHPAHLHLNVAPRLQGRGLGRALFERWATAARAAGAERAHIGVFAENAGGRAFWRAMGFEPYHEESDREGDALIYCGRRL